jgi:hypothetical protein
MAVKTEDTESLKALPVLSLGVGTHFITTYVLPFIL